MNATTPSNPSLFGWASNKTQGQRHKDHGKTNTSRQNPASFGIKASSNRSTHQLTTKHPYHVSSIESISGTGRNTVDGRAIGNLRHLQTKTLQYGLDDWTGDIEGSYVSTDTHANDQDAQTDEDRQL